jgi:hypothetical protein
MSNPKISKLLAITNNNDTSNLEEIKSVMKTYIASPWDAINKKIYNGNLYNQYRKEYNDKFASNIPESDLCSSKDPDPKSEINRYKGLLCKSHSGNLFEHSQWAALHILKWHDDKDPIMDGLDLETTLIAAFFHDIGKGGDCIKTTENGETWLDIYSKEKYNGEGEANHPIHCSNMILGKKDFIINCKNDHKINIKNLIEKEYPDVKIKDIALAALMHWEFGKLNIPGGNADDKVQTYLTIFNESCKTIEIEPSEQLLKLCIAVACADIAAGSNKRLLPNVGGITPADEVWLGIDPFVSYGMDKKYLVYRKSILDAFGTMSQFETMKGSGTKHQSPSLHSSRRSAERRSLSKHSRRRRGRRSLGGQRRTRSNNRRNKRTIHAR